MRRKSKPWPAFVDLFSALFIAAFAGFVLLTGKTADEVEKEEIRHQVDSLANKVKETLAQDEILKPKVYRLGDDLIVDLYIHFETNSDEIRDQAELEPLEQVIQLIKETIDNLEEEKRKDLEIIIEGHTDRHPPVNADDPRIRYLYNWNLSSKRATSLLYEFKRLGLTAPEYAVVAIGYADSSPICEEPTPECDQKNRRTTIRVRPDMARIEKRHDENRNSTNSEEGSTSEL